MALNTLEHYSTHGFFSEPTVAKAVFEQGHLIGNHSYNHPRLILKSPSFIKEQIIKTEQNQFVKSIELIIVELRNKGYSFVILDYNNLFVR